MYIITIHLHMFTLIVKANLDGNYKDTRTHSMYSKACLIKPITTGTVIVIKAHYYDYCSKYIYTHILDI